MRPVESTHSAHAPPAPLEGAAIHARGACRTGLSLGFGGLGCGVWGVGCGEWGVGSGVWGVGCGVWGVGCWVLGVGCWVWGQGIKIEMRDQIAVRNSQD